MVSDKTFFFKNSRKGGGVIRTKQEIEYDSIKVTKEYKNIRSSLQNELKKSGNATNYYLNLVEDYMDMYITKRLLVRDIRKRGITIEYNNGGGQQGFKKNDSVEQRLKVNAQMLKVLIELNISPANVEDGDEDESL